MDDFTCRLVPGDHQARGRQLLAAHQLLDLKSRDSLRFG
jgi:hypothetical protein